MKRKYDQIIVIDVECTCWKKLPPPGEESEIIEIGLCRLDIRSGERLEKRSILVKPEQSIVSPFCSDLTTLTQEQVEAGTSFEKACALLEREYLTQQRVWASYGNYDRIQFERQCRQRGVRYPFSANHINVKSLFTLTRRLQRDTGMAHAMQMLALPLEGRHHRGDDDAWNTARILWNILLERQG